MWVCILQNLCKYFKSGITKVKVYIHLKFLQVLQKCSLFKQCINLLSQQFVKVFPSPYSYQHQILPSMFLLLANLLRGEDGAPLLQFACLIASDVEHFLKYFC